MDHYKGQVLNNRTLCIPLPVGKTTNLVVEMNGQVFLRIRYSRDINVPNYRNH